MNLPSKDETTTPHVSPSHSRAASRPERYHVPGIVLPTVQTRATTKRYSPSDLDGFSDGFEVYNEQDGYNPTEYTESISPTQWMQDFALGFFCGEVDYCARESIAWLVGNLGSGLLVFGDVRDGIAASIRGDVIGATFCAIGIIPGLGDLAGGGSKIIKFVVKATKPATQTAALKQLRAFVGGPADYVKLLRQVDDDLVTSLKGRSVSDESIALLVNANGINRIKRMLGSPNLKEYSYSIPPTWMSSGEAGEEFMQNLIGIPGYRQTRTDVPRPDGGIDLRYADGISKENVGGVETITHYESKVGYAGSASVAYQAVKDSRLLLGGSVDAVEWHFFASEVSGKFGAPLRLIGILEDANIKIVMHLPL